MRTIQGLSEFSGFEESSPESSITLTLVIFLLSALSDQKLPTEEVLSIRSFSTKLFNTQIASLLSENSLDVAIAFLSMKFNNLFSLVQ
ncbi:MAG: hypothetical protein V4471_01890 [Pseudomonadota bacterium]